MRLRNWGFDKKLTRSFKFDFPVICVGNLSTGGTGKTPHIEFIISLLKDTYKVGVVSRGYGRNTKGFFVVNGDSEAKAVGDEPLQIKLNHPYANVAVGEQRIVAIPSLLQGAPETQVVLLDDAYQHRYVEAGLYVLLTDYNAMFYNDMVLPAGNLREGKRGYRRAEIIVVTKCPKNISVQEKETITKKIKPLPNQVVVFSYLQYGKPYKFGERKETLNHLKDKNVLFFAGIANTTAVESYLKENTASYEVMKLTDHYKYNKYNLKDLDKRFNEWSSDDKVILTTQKDAVKLNSEALKEIVEPWNLYVLPMEIGMNEEDKLKFVQHIETYIVKELSNTNEEEN
jgi:tetraacyldisaccharide 4'-kinase